MTVLAIGPRCESVSWEWVGGGMARELGRDHEVVIFDDFQMIPAAQIIMVVKRRPPAHWVTAARRGGAAVYFAPIDVYRERAEIAADGPMLRACDGVLLHADALRGEIRPYCSAIFRVEHHARFVLARTAAYKETGFLLWIGAFEHVPHVLHWLDAHPPPLEVRLLSNAENRAARIAAHGEAHRLGLRLHVETDRINGYAAERWTEASQARLMDACKAALDIKGASFSQRTKPPTKAQQFIASGIPFGCNPAHPAIEYFRKDGFEVCDAMDFARLLSRDYWAATATFATSLRERTALRTVGRAFRDALTGTAVRRCES